MEISENTFQDVKLDKFPDLDGNQFKRNDTAVSELCDSKYSIGKKIFPENSDHHRPEDNKAKQFKKSDEQSEKATNNEDMENLNNASNLFDVKGSQKPKNLSDNSLDHDSNVDNSQVSARIIMLDLDNTLIPTNWIMQTWRNIQCEMGNEGDSIDYGENESSLYELTEQIRNELVQVGLFDLLDQFFSDLWSTGMAYKIVIITNAGLRTVELFYLKYCLPKLGDILKKYNVEINSTEEYIRKKGPPPSPFSEEEYREFYTNAKLHEFQKVLLDCWGNNLECNDDFPSMFDVISAGDQACEMTAACRISKFYENKIRRTKLIYIHDPEDFRFWKQKPESFMKQLSETHRELLNLLSDDSETLIGCSDMNSTGFTNLEEENDEEFEEVALGWYCKGKYINIAISKPERFVLPQGSSETYLETERDYFEKEVGMAL
ncbi:hypothetical protein [Cryptosporidium parvum Iowa II]|uniref:Uncharacterized protein n=2 Tax=Cryptosporidium parvum TaxID=5807 RepID=Q5CXF2_CRYPI|nr:hypothetical protein [Cryptosporidium parvum Iowa II]QOY41009.1 HAD-like domain containing protein [Cryptosporidium parvum]WKS78238.1 hypothetical protein CPCDC_6g1310 [Cryptosporidium sp. 43IA8]EAK89812.1 hypothetical protein cgd6_1310 [Cryptosporidium parvum Iowa II]WRK32728.1 HAD-like domain containing protein [Cryptosporidium parvum]CAD98675.1 hypothetical predicted protein, unknown function [Cryptosporidium parvum]|eukprot:QOY41009.1 hypothetical protein CPATCC_002648 [Cryptosporidium parvum]